MKIVFRNFVELVSTIRCFVRIFTVDYFILCNNLTQTQYNEWRFGWNSISLNFTRFNYTEILMLTFLMVNCLLLFSKDFDYCNYDVVPRMLQLITYVVVRKIEFNRVTRPSSTLFVYRNDYNLNLIKRNY